MKLLSRLVLLFALATASLSAAEDKVIAAVRAADDERLAATQAVDGTRLLAIYSDDLRYAHSDGRVETKASLVKSLTSRDTIYESFAYEARDFTVACPGVVLMTGRVIMHASRGGQKVILDQNFLGVWREEGGQWRFLAWQSSRNPPAAK